MEFSDRFRQPMMGTPAALRLLRERFPALSHLIGDPENPDPETPEPYSSYEHFAEELGRRRDDRVFFFEACAFINEMALSNDLTLEDVLSVSVLESLAQDEELALLLYPNLNSAARDRLRAIEREYYGRDRD